MTVLVKALRVDCGISGVVFSKLFVLIVPTRTRYSTRYKYQLEYTPILSTVYRISYMYVRCKYSVIVLGWPVQVRRSTQCTVKLSCVALECTRAHDIERVTPSPRGYCTG